MKTETTTALLDACAAAAGALEGAARIFVSTDRPMVAKGLREVYTTLLLAMTETCGELVTEDFGRAAMAAIQKAKEATR